MIIILKLVILQLLCIKFLQTFDRLLKVSILLVLRDYLVIDTTPVSLKCLKYLLVRTLDVAVISELVWKDFRDGLMLALSHIKEPFTQVLGHCWTTLAYLLIDIYV